MTVGDGLLYDVTKLRHRVAFSQGQIVVPRVEEVWPQETLAASGITAVPRKVVGYDLYSFDKKACIEPGKKPGSLIFSGIQHKFVTKRRKKANEAGPKRFLDFF